MRYHWVVAGLFGCAGSLDAGGARRPVGEQLIRDPGLASVVCGYAVTGLRMDMDDRTREFVGVTTRKPAFGPPEADVVGVPVAARGVPAGATCAARLQFGYQSIAQANYRGDGGVVLLDGIVRVVSRSSAIPAGLWPRYLVDSPDFAIPLPPLGERGSYKFGERFVAAPGQKVEILRNLFEIVVEPDRPIRVAATCGTDLTNDVGPSGHRYPAFELSRHETKLARMYTDDTGYGTIDPAEQPGLQLEINYNGGSADGFVLSTPGSYQLNVLADCVYQLEIQRVSGASPPPHVDH